MDFNTQNNGSSSQNNLGQNNSDMNNGNSYYQNQNSNQLYQNNNHSPINYSNMNNDYSYQQNVNTNQQGNNQNYQHPINQNNTNSTDNKKQNKFKIIGIIAIITIIIIVAMMLFGKNKNSSGNGYTVNYGQNLKVNELNGVYNFEMEVLSIEKNYPINYIFYDTKGIAIKVSIKNTREGNLITGLLSFKLLDSKNNEISTVTSLSHDLIKNKSEAIDLSSNIESGKTVTGYLLFYGNDYEEDVDINDVDIAKLQVSVPSDILSEEYEDNFKYNVEEYYINLK